MFSLWYKWYENKTGVIYSFWDFYMSIFVGKAQYSINQYVKFSVFLNLWKIQICSPKMLIDLLGKSMLLDI